MTMSLSTASVVVAARDQVSADLEGETVILGIDKALYYGVDEVGATIWGLLREPTTVGAIRDQVVREYDVDPATCERDLVAFLEKLEAESLIEVTSDEGR
jgi:hypothetical protein